MASRIKLRIGLLVTSAIASSLLAAPAFAQDVPEQAADVSVAQTPPPVATVADEVPEATLPDDRLVAMGGIIRPFGGGILPYAGHIRGFAGPVSGTAGHIRGFGDTTASAGHIRGFAGHIRGFAGHIRGFSLGTIPVAGPDEAFWGKTYSAMTTLKANAGHIRGFAGEYEAMAGHIRGFAGHIRGFDEQLLDWDAGSATYTALNGKIAEMVAASKTTWGAAVQAQTKTSFELGYSDKMLAKYGIKLNDAESLVGMDELGFEIFMMDWYDGLMNFSGADQVDHWMETVRWNPALTQTMGAGTDSKIGLLDFAVTGSAASQVTLTGSAAFDASKVVETTDVTIDKIHGAAVASLMIAKHDGKGVMGIAPGAAVYAYNPFDHTNTAGWTDIRNGINALVAAKATIINMSLGVPKKTLDGGWNTVFTDSETSKEAKKRVFVLAAGNEGTVQTGEVSWDFIKNPNIVIVGSVDHNDKISAFSNTPGETKIKKVAGNDPIPNSNDMLKSRFITAPGEFILVDDGAGGVTRMSGTSFAAPLVSGAIALIHDRWKWLAAYPAETVNIILDSARDVGAPGTDGTYGRGILDVQAALSPMNWQNMLWRRTDTNGKTQELNASNVLSVSDATARTWKTSGVYFTMFEDLLDSDPNKIKELSKAYRDFHVPLASKLLGDTVGNTGEQFQGYLASRFWQWFDGARGRTTPGFAAERYAAPLTGFGEVAATVTATPRTWRPMMRQSGAAFDTGLSLGLPGDRVTLGFGSGSGVDVTGAQGFAMQSDYDLRSGGANPFLGLASGAGYGTVAVALTDRVTVSTGVSRRDDILDYQQLSQQQREVFGRVDPYRASASMMSLAYKANGALTATISYTMLNEDTGLLGTRSLDPADFAGGSTTDAATLGADLGIGSGLSLALTGTVGRTRAGDLADQQMAVSGSGLVSSAWQVGVTKMGVFGQDRARFTVAQPLHLEAGQVSYKGLEVIDRNTGEIGEVTQRFGIDTGERRLVAEFLYGRTLDDGKAEFNLFGRANVVGERAGQEPSVTVGSSFRLTF